jgi:hypothetical protein
MPKSWKLFVFILVMHQSKLCHAQFDLLANLPLLNNLEQVAVSNKLPYRPVCTNNKVLSRRPSFLVLIGWEIADNIKESG